MLLRPPQDGLEGVPADGALIARMPVYGTRDAGRGLWKKIRARFKDHGMKENRIMSALFSISNEKNDIVCMLGTHVDDILWAADDESQKIIDRVLAEFDIREIKEGNFRYCGLDIVQDENSTVNVSAKDNIEKIEAISYPGDSQLTRKCNEGEVSQLRSVVGAVSWVSRQCKPELLYRVSRLQTVVNHAKVFHLKEANKVLEDAVQSADIGLVFKGGAVKWDNDMIVLTITDASWSGEQAVVRGSLEPLRSQKARFNGLSGSGFIDGDSDNVHPICLTRNVIRRVCKSTLQAETLACLWGVESGVRIRAAIADARGLLGQDRKIRPDWEEVSAMTMRHLWMTDCKSLEEHLTASTLGKVEDKRLSIDLCSLRQDIWTNGEEELEILHPSKFCDKIRWIDTSIMAVDCLTKAMPTDFLVNILQTSLYDVTPDPDSTMKKVKKQLARAKTPTETPKGK